MSTLKQILPVSVCALACTLFACSDKEEAASESTKGTEDLSGLDSGDAPPTPDLPVVFPKVETKAVKGFGDAADDPAIWVNPIEPEKSLILGTDKTVSGGLFVYNLDGSERAFLELGELNNVDLRPGFELNGKEVTLVTATNRTDDSLTILALDPDTLELTDVAAESVHTIEESYGNCMYKNAAGEFFSFANGKDGTFIQYKLTAEGEKVQAEEVRRFCVETQPEGCVADDAGGRIFVGEEAFGVWVFPAEADAESTGDEEPLCAQAIGGTKLASTLDGDLARDVEGMALFSHKDNDYLMVSAQGQHEFVVFEAEAPYEKVLTFAVWGGGEACIDGVEETDGLDVVAANLGPDFPEGVLVVQDGFNGDPLEKQNFKLIDLREVFALMDDDAQEFEPNLSCKLGDYGGKPRFADLPPGPERTEEFCAEFCSKCDSCYEEGGAFSEGDCHYKSGKPIFDKDDCLAGCSVGSIPADTRPLQSGWQEWECLDLDDAL